MKELTLEEYEKQVRSLVWDILAGGDIIRVDCGEAGALIVREE